MRFKVKGDEHTTSKVASMAALSPEVCATLVEFVEKSVTDNRCEQGVTEIFKDAPVSLEWFKKTKMFVQWVLADIKKEDLESAPQSLKSGAALTKEAEDAIGNKAREWLRRKIEM